MCRVHLVELVNAAHHASQAALPPGPVEQLSQLDEIGQRYHISALGKTLDVSRKWNRQSRYCFPPKSASIRPDAGLLRPP
jgi:hypothetical protein